MKEVTELIGKTGTLTRPITIAGAVQAEDGTIDVLVQDDHGNEFWVEKDASVTLI